MVASRRAFLVAAVGSAVGFLGVAPAAARPAFACTRVGQETVVAGVLFRCVRRRDRLIWRRVGAVAPEPTTPLVPTPPAPTGWVDVVALNSLPAGRAVVRAVPVTSGPAPELLLARGVATRPETVRAFDARCTHRGCIVAVEDDTVICRCHQSTFSPVDGSRLAGPAPTGLPEFEVDVRGSQVYVRLP